MTELEQAWAHLRKCQSHLAHARDVSVFEEGQWYPGNMIADAAKAVLAALSWVWDAQEREVTSTQDALAHIYGLSRRPGESDTGLANRVSAVILGELKARRQEEDAPANYKPHPILGLIGKYRAGEITLNQLGAEIGL